MSGAAMRAPEWFPRTQQEAAEVDQLLRQNTETIRQVSGQVGRLEGRVDDMAHRQDKTDAALACVDSKLDRVLANQQSFGWVIKFGWAVALACSAVGAWVWDHWPLFGGR